MITKKEAIAEAKIEGRTEAFDDMLTTLDDFIDEQVKLMEAYPKNTKFIELQIDILEDFKDKLKYTYDIK